MPEQLCRLNAKTQSYMLSSYGFGGLTVSDLCAALANTDAIGRLAMIYRSTGHMDMEDLKELHWKIIKFFNKKRWVETNKESKNKTIWKFTKLCLIEYTDKEPYCGTCKGPGWLYGKKCHVCKGSGKGFYTAAFRARALGIPRTSYVRHWEDRRKEVLYYLSGFIPELESSARRCLYRKLRD